MKGLWLQLDYYQNFKIKCSEYAMMLQKFVESEGFFNFLKDSMWSLIKSECKLWERSLYLL